MNTGKVLLGLIAGFAAGASLGIIMAPAKGSETRKKIMCKRVDSNDPLIETFIEFLSSVAGDSENIDKIADELIAKVKSTLHYLAKERKERSTVVTESGTYKI